MPHCVRQVRFGVYSHNHSRTHTKRILRITVADSLLRPAGGALRSTYCHMHKSVLGPTFNNLLILVVCSREHQPVDRACLLDMLVYLAAVFFIEVGGFPASGLPYI